VKAVFFHQHGGPEVLALGDLPDPAPAPGQVLVRLRAAALNRVDLFVRQGWPGLNLEMPHIPGADGAGELAALGEGVMGRRIGERVVVNANLGCGRCPVCLQGRDNLCQDWHLLGETVRGTYAQYVAVPASNAFPVPAGFDLTAAAACSLVYLTAWHSLVTRGALQPGETVLVVGASGGVNTASIQIAKHLGARVLVVGSGPAKLALAESLGADVLIDRSREEDWSKPAFQATKRRGADVVVDNVIAGTLPLSLRAARKGGRILTVGNTAGPKVEIDNRFLFSKHLSILGSTMGTQAEFAEMLRIFRDGKVKPVVDAVFPLAKARDAEQRLEEKRQFGKIVIRVD
jgi:NADPH:quinone reductase-like Zn-dependent oxidoreductase